MISVSNDVILIVVINKADSDFIDSLFPQMYEMRWDQDFSSSGYIENNVFHQLQSAAVNSEETSKLADPTLLETIDKLFELNMGD